MHNKYEKKNSHGFRDPITYLISPNIRFSKNPFLLKYLYNIN